jgi:streptogramin lyase
MKYLQSPACLACLSIIVAVVTSARANEKPPAPLLIETVAGSGQGGDLPPGGGEALRVSLDQPFGVEVAPHGALHITSVGQHRVLRLDPQSRKLTVVAGTGAKGYSGDGGPARDAKLNEPYEVRFDAEGNLYFVEMQNHLVRLVAARGTISTLAGSGQPGYGGDDGPAAAAQFRQPHSIALDDRGFLYVADIGNFRIRRIDLAAGTISSIAGNGQHELPRDGSLALGQPILGPRALATTGRTLWIALREGHSVWRLDLDSLKITHVAGTGKAGYSGDGGPPADATFNGPKGIAATSGGLVYVVDSENQAIRLVDVAANRIYTVAGGGPQARGFGGDGGAALSAKFDRPHGICVAPDGTVFIGDTNNHRVRRLRP